MRYLVAIITLLISTFFAAGQDSWKISLNKITILVGHESNELLNIKKIKSIEWKKNGYLEVSYKEAFPNNWLHSIAFTDDLGNQLLTKDSTTTAKIPIAVLRKFFAGKKQLKIYMVISPPNPMMAAPTRMLHLGTLRLP